MAQQPSPAGYHTLTPAAAVRDCDRAIEFYKKVFGAQERMRFTTPDGKVAHCELQIGDSIFMLGEPMNSGPRELRAMLYVDDCDAVFDRAVRAGASPQQPPANQFYGDRSGRLADPFGNEWFIATHVEDISADEMQRRWDAMAQGLAQAAE